MMVYANFADYQTGLDRGRFCGLLSALLNVENHPLAEDLFLQFDTNNDGVVWFLDFMRVLDTMERGDFE